MIIIKEQRKIIIIKMIMKQQKSNFNSKTIKLKMNLQMDQNKASNQLINQNSAILLEFE